MEMQDVDTLFGDEASDANIPEDFEQRDEILRIAIRWIGANTWIPLTAEKDINRSYAEDSLKDFRKNVRSWLVELRRAG